MARKPKHTVHVIGCLYDEPGVTICICPGDLVWTTEKDTWTKRVSTHG